MLWWRVWRNLRERVRQTWDWLLEGDLNVIMKPNADGALEQQEEEE